MTPLEKEIQEKEALLQEHYLAYARAVMTDSPFEKVHRTLYTLLQSEISRLKSKERTNYECRDRYRNPP